MNNNCYDKQKERALKRKLELIELKGGKCQICGYDKNIAALDFHHTNPEEKSFQLDSRHLSNTNIEILKEEAEKCILVCANCHREIHNEHFNKENISVLLNEYHTKNIKVLNHKNKTQKCLFCGNEFKPVKGKKYCSKECALNDKHYPSYEEVMITYNKLKSWDKVANAFNLTRKIIIGIRNRNR